MKKIIKNIILHEVKKNYARYILKLRTNKKFSKYIKKTDNDILKQKIWLNNYFKRRRLKIEYYFIFKAIFNFKLNKIGIGRIIKINDKSFHIGGFILENKSKSWHAIAICLALYEFAFFMLKFKKCLLWVNTKNKRIINFHKLFGAKIYKKKAKLVYLSLTFKDYLLIKKKFSYFYK